MKKFALWVGYIWVTLALSLIAVSIIFMFISLPFPDFWRWITKTFSPFNLWNFAAVLITIGPGLLLIHYGKKPSKTARQEQDAAPSSLEQANIISDYGAFLENNPSAGEIRDVIRLPHDKEAILDAICVEIAEQDDDKYVDVLKTCALFLADYQEGIGDKPISMLGVDLPKDPASMSEDDLKILAEKINTQEWERYKPLMDKDISNIQARLMVAEQVRREISAKE